MLDQNVALTNVICKFIFIYVYENQWKTLTIRLTQRQIQNNEIIENLVPSNSP